MTWYCNTYQVTVTKTFRRILIGPRTEEVVHTFTAPGHVFVSDPRSQTHTATHTKTVPLETLGAVLSSIPAHLADRLLFSDWLECLVHFLKEEELFVDN